MERLDTVVHLEVVGASISRAATFQDFVSRGGFGTCYQEHKGFCAALRYAVLQCVR